MLFSQLVRLIILSLTHAARVKVAPVMGGVMGGDGAAPDGMSLVPFSAPCRFWLVVLIFFALESRVHAPRYVMEVRVTRGRRALKSRAVIVVSLAKWSREVAVVKRGKGKGKGG
ncbi:hypothetical protein E2C01_053187 [Portunus trituberculatus]|uniref:Secreted protein n=1 Tax=Portunus trituberculatus TaxID=210409 RepID=A0A5B7GJL3_PORTR|nr:hypothetical protein [Portunus trituberculatus]